MRTETDAIALHDDDSVATALHPLVKGVVARIDTPNGVIEVVPTEDIRRCHKFALHAIAAGDSVRKYGEIIGDATQAIPAGAHVHIHNLTGRAGKRTGGNR